MSKHAFIELVPSSSQQSIDLDEIKELLMYYYKITEKTGHQLNWDYENFAFPYSVSVNSQGAVPILHLQSAKDRYSEFFIGVKNNENPTSENANIIFFSLSNKSTYGDKGKAIELCKFISQKLQGKLTLFNERVMFYNKR